MNARSEKASDFKDRLRCLFKAFVLGSRNRVKNSFTCKNANAKAPFTTIRPFDLRSLTVGKIFFKMAHML